MSTSTLGEDIVVLPSEAGNNNNTNLVNLNLPATSKEASNIKLLEEESENDVILPLKESNLHESPPSCEVSTYNYSQMYESQDSPSPQSPRPTSISQSPHCSEQVQDISTNPTELENLPKSILRFRNENENSDLVLKKESSQVEDVPLPNRNVKTSSESLSSSQTKRVSSSGSHSKIPIPISTIKRSGRKKKRKNSITELAGDTRLSECIYEALINDEVDNSQNMSDGYIDKIILQSCNKSIDRGLDSSGDLLDDSEDVFEEQEERRKEAQENIVMKFLEMTAEKPTSTNLSPAICVRLESKGATPVMNLKTNFLNRENVEIARSVADEGFLPKEEEVRNLESKVSLYEGRMDSLGNLLGTAKVAVVEKDLKCDKMWGDLKDLEIDLVSSNDDESGGFVFLDRHSGDNTESNRIEMVAKDLELKLSMYESKIETLEGQLKIAKALADEKDLNCEELKREGRLLMSRPDESLDDFEGKDSTKVEHVVKGFENKLSLYENKIETMEDQLRIAKASAEDKDRTCDEIGREMKVTEAERNTLEAKAKEMDVDMNLKKIRISDLVEELRTTKSKYVQLEVEFVNESKKVESCESKIKASDVQINGFEIELNSLKRKLEICVEENENIKEEMKIKIEDIDKKSSEIEESNRRVDVFKLDITKFEKSYQDASMRLIKSVQCDEEKEVKIRNLETKIRELESDLTSFNTQSTKLEDKMKELEKEEFKNKRSLFERSSEKVDLSCKKCENLGKKLNNLQSKCETVEEKLNDAMEQHDVLAEVNNQLKSEIDESLDKNEKLIAEYKAKETDIIGKESEISGLRNNKFTMEENCLKLETNLKATSEKLETMTGNCDESERNLNVAKANNLKMEENVEKFNCENEALKTANKLMEDEFKNHNRFVQATDSTLSKCEAALEATRKDFDANRQELKTAEYDLNSTKASKQEIDMKYDKLVIAHDITIVKLSEAETRAEDRERTVVKLEKENEKLFEDWTSEKTKNTTVVQGFEDEVSELMRL
eukprot:GFUD01045015.1.p1 GENE.GFUD01045015.1~~GFUD01045015.1.p1  ORF type:complete len:1008 (+),score=269.92 GFUD01045015.1:117-3140(+)